MNKRRRYKAKRRRALRKRAPAYVRVLGEMGETLKQFFLNRDNVWGRV
jgi:hypothetical protein